MRWEYDLTDDRFGPLIGQYGIRCQDAHANGDLAHGITPALVHGPGSIFNTSWIVSLQFHSSLPLSLIHYWLSKLPARYPVNISSFDENQRKAYSTSQALAIINRYCLHFQTHFGISVSRIQSIETGHPRSALFLHRCLVLSLSKNHARHVITGRFGMYTAYSHGTLVSSDPGNGRTAVHSRSTPRTAVRSLLFISRKR